MRSRRSSPFEATWRPILDQEDEVGEVYRVIEAITRALQSLEVNQRGGPSVAGGRAGTGILYAYLARALPGRGYEEAALAEVDEAIAAVAGTPLPPALYGGFPGIGWMVEHLRDSVPGIDDETNEGIDEGILTWLEGPGWEGDYDLINGLVGLGVYAMERLPHAGGEACLVRVIDRLAEASEEQAGGITWWTRPELLSVQSRKDYPEGWYNLGLAHGVPGVIALLGEAYERGIASSRVRSLLDGAVRWLLGRKLPETIDAVFPSCLSTDVSNPPKPSRSAWCHGDPGVAIALLSAARRAGDLRWEAEALTIARKAACRPLGQAGIVDAGLCHGAAGLGHIWNRFFQATGEPLFRDAARFWLRRTLEMHRPGQGLAGYLAWKGRANRRMDEDVELAWLGDPGLLTGVTGIALALLAAVSSIEPEWDRLLLTNV
jgi:lantibiotic biosynthesis protein